MKPVARGYVLKIGRRYVWVRLRKVRGRVWYDAQFDLNKLYTKERAFLEPGAYCALLKGGTLRFSRLRWRKKDLEHAQQRARSLLHVFHVQPDPRG